MPADTRLRNEPPLTNADRKRLWDALPPHSIESEMTTLGSMIVAGTESIHVIAEVMEVIDSPDDFYVPKHAAIYQAICDVYDANQSVDTVQLTQRLRDSKLYDSIGGTDYLIELAEGVPTSINGPHYARIVRNKARERHLLNSAGKIIELVHDDDAPIDEKVDQAERLIMGVSNCEYDAQVPEMSELIAAKFEEMDAASANPTGLKGPATGFEQLDSMTCGLPKGEMIIVAARPSMGKTAYALQIMDHVAVHSGIPTLFFSMEMGKNQIAERLLSMRAEVNGMALRRNMINSEQRGRIEVAAVDLSNAPILIDDTPGLRINQMRGRARRHFARRNIGLIIVDYLQLMSGGGGKSNNRQEEVAEMSRGVKAMARDLDVPVLCLSQLNRNPEGRTSKRPMIGDLRESGAIEQDADTVLMLHREDYYHAQDEDYQMTHTAEVIIGKQRNGPTGSVSLVWKSVCTKFEDMYRGDTQGSMF